MESLLLEFFGVRVVVRLFFSFLPFSEMDVAVDDLFGLHEVGFFETDLLVFVRPDFDHIHGAEGLLFGENFVGYDLDVLVLEAVEGAVGELVVGFELLSGGALVLACVLPESSLDESVVARVYVEFFCEVDDRLFEFVFHHLVGFWLNLVGAEVAVIIGVVVCRGHLLLLLLELLVLLMLGSLGADGLLDLDLVHEWRDEIWVADNFILLFVEVERAVLGGIGDALLPLSQISAAVVSATSASVTVFAVSARLEVARSIEVNVGILLVIHVDIVVSGFLDF